MTAAMKQIYMLLTLAAALCLPLPAAAADPAANETEVSVTEQNTGDSIPAATVGAIIVAVVGGLGFVGGRKSAVKIEPSPLEVRDADKHYVTQDQLNAELRRIYDKIEKNDKGLNDKIDENSKALNQLVGIVQGIRDTLMAQKKTR